MNFREAMQALLDGNQVRRAGWSNPEFRLAIEGGALVCAGGTTFFEPVDRVDAKATDWELYEPPPPKMTLAEAVAAVARSGCGTIRRRSDHPHFRLVFTESSVAADDWEVLP